ncbi:MAG: hypothetical protein WD225_15395 [Ilumatobacteraceae bacterium]
MARLAAPQHGVVSTAQLTAQGVGWRRWHRLVERGWLDRVVPGVLVVAGSPVTWERSLWVAVLALGPAARVSHRAAAALHQLDRSRRDTVEVTVPRAERGRGRSAAHRVTVHTSEHIGPTDSVRVSNLRVTSATRTVIDLARLRVPRAELEASIDSAVRRGLSSPIVLERRLAELRGRGRWGCRLLDELLVDSGGHTMLERRFLRLVREAGLPRPRTQVVHRRGSRTVARVDFCYDEYDLVIEVSGAHGHSSPAERAVDAQRRNELQELGRTVYEYTWQHVVAEQAYVCRSLEHRLRLAGWRP